MLSHCRRLPTATSNRWTKRVEAVAVRIAAQAEVDRGAEVQDVSSPEKARAAGLSDWPGFDLLSRYSDGQVRSIEVKGRAGRSAVRMELNEWKQACNLGETLLALRGVRVCNAGAAALSGSGPVSESAGVGTWRPGVYDYRR